MTTPAAPRFAMSFTHDAVILEQREDDGWQPLGEARFDRGDLAVRLAALRDARANSASAPDSGPDTVLVIPEDQILYTTLTVAPGAEPRQAVVRALDGLTPYKVEELAFDFAGSPDGQGDALQVAAVARRTLEEAEEFAIAQGFQPARFTARPTAERFPGTPDFGASALAHAEAAALAEKIVPDFARAGVTAPGIAPAHDEQPLAPAGPMVSRIVPHVALPVASMTAQPAGQTEQNEVVTERLTAALGSVARTRPAPDAAAPTAQVIRHGSAGSAQAEPTTPPLVAAPAVAEKPLNPRAKALLARAAEAKSRRTDAPAPVENITGKLRALWTRRPKKLRPIGSAAPALPQIGTLPAMLSILGVALVAALLIWGGRPSSQPVEPQIAVADPDAAPPSLPAPVETTPAPPVSETAAITPESPVAAPQDPLTAALAEAMDTKAVEDTTEADNQDIADAAPVAPVQPVETAAAEPQTTIIPPAPVETAAVGPAAPADAAPTDATPTDDTAAASTPEPAQVTASSNPAPVAATPAPSANSALALRSSARPQSAPPVRTAAPATADTAPSVPQNPQPFAQRSEPEPARVAPVRPLARPAAAPAPRAAAAPMAPPPAQAQAAPAGRPGARPPRRPATLDQGSAAEPADEAALTPSERRFLDTLARDLRQAGLSGGAFDARMTMTEPTQTAKYAQARPQRKPGAAQPTATATATDAVAAAAAPSNRPAAARSNNDGLARSTRPTLRPGGARQVATSSANAIDGAVAAAVADTPAAALGLRISMLPPRRPGGRDTAVAGAATATATAAAAAAVAPTATAAAAAQPDAAAIERQRREDEALQAQAEARARARAQADARAEAQARAQAEARARAQAEAEARAAAARQQQYRPPEAEDEPEAPAATRGGGGVTPGSVASAATVKDGITLNRTQIIGTIGAGKGSRALVRLSRGQIITLRIGDRINGGTITAIGDGRITYVKSGRQAQLAVLDGR